MFMRPRTSAAVDGESLQTDVMRFMAIIAFCLVAIMALVRDVTPAKTDFSAPPQAARAEPEASIDKNESLAAAPQEPVVPTVAPPVDAPPVDKPDPVEPPRSRTPAPQPTETVLSEPATADSDEGLSLRFGSDQDFLRLLAKGEVGVYLFREQSAYRLGRNYAFSPSAPPRQLYELMPETIPAGIRLAAEDAALNLADFRWGVAMPESITARIEALVAVERSGELVINRFGEVAHQNAPDPRHAGG